MNQIIINQFRLQVPSLKKAAQLDKENARFSYVYAISLGDKDPKKAIEILEEAYLKYTGDLQIVSELAYYYKQIGDIKKSKEYEKKVKALQNFFVRYIYTIRTKHFIFKTL